MRLLRLAIIGLTDPAPSQVLQTAYTASNGLVVSVNDVADAAMVRERTPLSGIQFIWPRGTAEVQVAVSTVVSGLVPTTLGQSVHIPSAARRSAEYAIEEFADILAISHQCRRIVRSSEPCLALVADTDEELPDGSYLAPPQGRSPNSPRLLDPLVEPEVATLVHDRMVGATLLASALSGTSPLERAREFYRLFEAAFASGMGAMTKKLFAFLSTSPYGMEYTTTELHTWVSLRGAIMHADKKVALGVDIEPHLGRMEWAAYDLLLHKKNWGTTDATRREGLAFKSGLVPSRGVVVWGEASVRTTWLDPFGIYEVDQRMTPNLGEEFITAFSQQTNESS